MSSPRLFTLNRTLINKDLLSRIHTLWFADQPSHIPTTPTPASVARWFYNPDKSAAAAFDDECRALCGPALSSLSPSSISLPPFTDWRTEHAQSTALAQPFWDAIESTPLNSLDQNDTELDTLSRDALSLFLLVDQIPRNIYRKDQGVIYAHYDRLGQAFARTMLDRRPRLDLAPWVRERLVMRTWFYLPLMHSEDLQGDHARLRALMDGMREEWVRKGDEEGVKAVDENLDFEKRHAVILERFGRYPYRNKALGRKSTEAEEEYERSGGEKFTA